MKQAPTNKKTISGHHAFRKVFRQGIQHLCGLCGSSYSDRDQAESCLDGCLKHILSLGLVKPRRRFVRGWVGKEIVFRCHLCEREHKNEAKAKHCAKQCAAEVAATREARVAAAPYTKVKFTPRPGHLQGPAFQLLAGISLPAQPHAQNEQSRYVDKARSTGSLGSAATRAAVARDAPFSGDDLDEDIKAA